MVCPHSSWLHGQSIKYLCENEKVHQTVFACSYGPRFLLFEKIFENFCEYFKNLMQNFTKLIGNFAVLAHATFCNSCHRDMPHFLTLIQGPKRALTFWKQTAKNFLHCKKFQNLGFPEKGNNDYFHFCNNLLNMSCSKLTQEPKNAFKPREVRLQKKAVWVRVYLCSTATLCHYFS